MKHSERLFQHPKFYSPFNNAGFTLIELIVVLAIIAITGSFSLYIISEQLPLMRLNNGVSTLRGTISAQKSLAIKNATTSIIEIDPNSSKFSVYSDENNDGRLDGPISIPDVTSPMGGSLIVPDEFIASYSLPPQVQFGIDSGPDAPANGPAAGIGISDPVSCAAGKAHLKDGKYYLAFDSQAKFNDRNKNLSHCVIYLNNAVGDYAAIEILAGGAVIPWRYNVKGDGQWVQK